MNERAPQSPAQEQSTLPDFRQELELSLGPVPQELERPVAWAGGEAQILADAVIEHTKDPDALLRFRRKAQSRIVATGLALATMAGIGGATKAEAGERRHDDGWRRGASVVSVVARIGERVADSKQDEHRQNAYDMSRQRDMLEREGERLLRSMDRINRRLDTIERHLGRAYGQERHRIEDERADLEQDKRRLFQRAEQLDGERDRLDRALHHEVGAAQKSGLWGAIASIIGDEVGRARYR